MVRKLVLLADTRGDVRRDRLQRSAEVLSTCGPFAGMDAGVRVRMIHEQTLVAHFEPEAGLAALPKLLGRSCWRRRMVAGTPFGNGASMCAIRNGRSVASTMEFSALDGLPMGTRCGQLDPGVIL